MSHCAFNGFNGMKSAEAERGSAGYPLLDVLTKFYPKGSLYTTLVKGPVLFFSNAILLQISVPLRSMIT